jgi:hypothetical protein
MATLTFNIQATLTASQIIRNCPSAIDESEAAKLAQEAHAIIAEVRARYVRHPLVLLTDDDGRALARRMPSDDECAYTLADLVDAVRRTILGFWSANQDAAVAEPDWVEEQLTWIDDALYARYLRLCDRIQGTNYAESLADPPSLTH